MMQRIGNTSHLHDGLQFAKSTSRTHYISKELREGGLVGQKVDYLYVSMRICIYSVEITPS